MSKDKKEKKEKKNLKITKKHILMIGGIVIGIAAIVLIIIFLILPAVNYSTAQKSFEKGDYEKAIECFSKDLEYKESKTKLDEVYFEYGKKLIKDKKHKEALEAFGKTTNQNAPKYVAYTEALIKVENKAFTEAINEFAALGEFEDSKELVTSTTYLYAEHLMETANYSKAKENYGKIKEYKDSAEKIVLSDFMDAEKKYSEGSLAEAQKIFKTIDPTFEHNGVKVSDRLAKLTEYKTFVNMTGTWNGNGKHEVRQYWKYDYSWDGWEGSYTTAITVKCIIQEDGSVKITGDAGFYSYTDYSSLSYLLKDKYVEVPINLTVKKGEKIPSTLEKYPALIAANGTIGYATLTYSGGKYKLSFKLDDKNHSQSFRELYTSKITYSKKVN